MKSRCAGRNRNRMTRSHILSKFLFELKGPGAHRQPAGTYYFSSGLRFLLTHSRHMEGNRHHIRFLSHGPPNTFNRVKSCQVSAANTKGACKADAPEKISSTVRSRAAL